jgi:hypothetical protein
MKLWSSRQQAATAAAPGCCASFRRRFGLVQLVKRNCELKRAFMLNLTAFFNPLTPNDPYRVRTELLTSKRCILYIYSTNIGTEYF